MDPKISETLALITNERGKEVGYLLQVDASKARQQELITPLMDQFLAETTFEIKEFSINDVPYFLEVPILPASFGKWKQERLVKDIYGIKMVYSSGALEFTASFCGTDNSFDKTYQIDNVKINICAPENLKNFCEIAMSYNGITLFKMSKASVSELSMLVFARQELAKLKGKETFKASLTDKMNTDFISCLTYPVFNKLQQALYGSSSALVSLGQCDGFKYSIRMSKSGNETSRHKESIVTIFLNNSYKLFTLHGKHNISEFNFEKKFLLYDCPSCTVVDILAFFDNLIEKMKQD